MFEAYASPTVKSYHPTSQWSRYPDSKIASAETLRELREKLSQHYGRSWKNKRPMYCDMKDGSTKRTGWVVGMRMQDGSDKWIQQDWVSVVEIKPVYLNGGI